MLPLSSRDILPRTSHLKFSEVAVTVQAVENVGTKVDWIDWALERIQKARDHYKLMKMPKPLRTQMEEMQKQLGLVADNWNKWKVKWLANIWISFHQLVIIEFKSLRIALRYHNGASSPKFCNYSSINERELSFMFRVTDAACYVICSSNASSMKMYLELEQWETSKKWLNTY